MILFDGGLRTPLRAFRVAWKPAALLATVGVLVTAVVTGVAASAVLGITLLEGILLGSIVGSTDAAAVFAILRSRGLNLEERLGSTLEIETRPLVERIFGRDPLAHVDLPPMIEFPLMGSTTVEELWEFYGIRLGMPGGLTLDEVIRQRLGDSLAEGSTLYVGGVSLHVREISDGRVLTVGLAIAPSVEL